MYYYKVLYHEAKNLIDYAKWLNAQREENELELVAVNGNYHIFVDAQQTALQAYSIKKYAAELVEQSNKRDAGLDELLGPE